MAPRPVQEAIAFPGPRLDIGARMSSVNDTSSSQLESALRAGRFVITAEIAPPVSFDPQDLLAKARSLLGLADAVNVTDGASARTHMSALVAAALLAREGIEPILQLTCR